MNFIAIFNERLLRLVSVGDFQVGSSSTRRAARGPGLLKSAFGDAAALAVKVVSSRAQARTIVQWAHWHWQGRGPVLRVGSYAPDGELKYYQCHALSAGRE